MKKPTGRVWAIAILTTLILLAFIPSAILKLTMAPVAVQGMMQAGIPAADLRPIGVLELFCLALFLIPRTSVTGTMLLTGYLGGALLTNLVSHNSFIHVLVVGLMVWVVAWLRVPELRPLFPVRRQL